MNDIHPDYADQLAPDSGLRQFWLVPFIAGFLLGAACAVGAWA